MNADLAHLRCKELKNPRPFKVKSSTKGENIYIFEHLWRLIVHIVKIEVSCSTPRFEGKIHPSMVLFSRSYWKKEIEADAS